MAVDDRNEQVKGLMRELLENAVNGKYSVDANTSLKIRSITANKAI